MILRRQSPLPVNHPIGQQETKDELTKQEGVGERRAPFGQHFAPTKDNDSQTNNVFSGQCSADVEVGGLRPNECDLPAP